MGSRSPKLSEGEKSSWVNVMKTKSCLTNHTIEVLDMAKGSGVVEISDDVVTESVPLCEDFLEGRFMSDAPHVAKKYMSSLKEVYYLYILDATPVQLAQLITA